MTSGKTVFRRILILSAAMLFLLLLTSCNSNRAPAGSCSVTVEADGQPLTVIFDEHTFSSGKMKTANGEYTFQYEAQSNGIRFTVTYPDGYVYSQTEINGGIATPYDYDANERKAKGYMDGFSLAWAVDTAADQAQGNGNRNGPSPLLAVLLLGCGAWNLFAPRAAWWLAWGWRYKNAEPSDPALMLYRILGIVLLLAGILCLAASF